MKINKLPKNLKLIKFDAFVKCEIKLNEIKEITNAIIDCRL